MHRSLLLALLALLACPLQAADAPRATSAPPKAGKLPHVEFDSAKKQVRVECEMLGVNTALEFYCCVKGTNDYEAMIRSEVKPSDLHFALLAIGLKPGEPLKYSEALKKSIPPHGPPLQLTMEYQKDGKTIRDPAWKWLRDIKSKKTAPPITWVFAGSRVMPDGKYAADVTGYIVSLANTDITVIDLPDLISRSLELLEWERNPDITPKAGTKVWMVIEPAGNSQSGPGSQPASQPAAHRTEGAGHAEATTTAPSAGLDVTAQVAAADKRAKELKDYWDQQVALHRDALREAAEAHYKVVQELRAQQQRLIDEADRLQRTIDELEKDYQDLTTPRPAQGT